MRTTEHTPNTNQRMRAHRARLRAAGLRPVQIWVPDVRLPRISKQARRQSLMAARRESELEALNFIEHAADTGEDE